MGAWRQKCRGRAHSTVCNTEMAHLRAKPTSSSSGYFPRGLAEDDGEIAECAGLTKGPDDMWRDRSKASV